MQHFILLLKENMTHSFKPTNEPESSFNSYKHFFNKNNRLSLKDFIGKLSEEGPGYLYGMDRVINREQIEAKMELKVMRKLNGISAPPDNYPVENSNNIDDNNNNYSGNNFSNNNYSSNDFQQDYNSNNNQDYDSGSNYDYQDDDCWNDYETKNKDIKKMKRIKKIRMEKIASEKIKMLNYLDKLRDKGVDIEQLSDDTPFEKVKRLTMKHRQKRKIEFGKDIFIKILLDLIKLIEYGSSQIDILGINLEGWHSSVKFSLTEHDDIVEEIIENHTGEEGEGFSPEVKLGILLLMSGVDIAASNGGIKSKFGGIANLFSSAKETEKNLPNYDYNFDFDEDNIEKEIEARKLSAQKKM